MNSVTIGHNDIFRIDDVEFHIDNAAPSDRRKSQLDSFTIVKDRELVEFYFDLARSLRVNSLLELGIFEGGGYVFLDKLFKPKKMSAVDLRETPVDALVDYTKRRDARHVHFRTSQNDERALTSILENDLGGELDMVVDDASHDYFLTRRSFELLFPRLSAGGSYIIEDWAWSHQTPFQGPGAPGAQKPALTNLVFDLIQLQGSTNLIAETRVCRSMVIVQKSKKINACPKDIFSLIRNRGKNLNQI